MKKQSSKSAQPKTYCKVCKRDNAGQPNGYCASCATDLVTPPLPPALRKPRCPQCDSLGKEYGRAPDLSKGEQQQYMCTNAGCRALYEACDDKVLDARPHINVEKRETQQEYEARHKAQQLRNKLQPPRGPNRTR